MKKSITVEGHRVMVSVSTSYLADPLLLDLIRILDKCSDMFGGCETCPVKQSCLAWWNRIVKRSTFHRLRNIEYIDAIKDLLGRLDTFEQAHGVRVAPLREAFTPLLKSETVLEVANVNKG